MNWKFWQKHSQQPVQSIRIDDLASSFLGCSLMNEKITPQKAFSFYQQNSAIATAVDLISDTFEQINPVIQLPNGQIIEEHPILDLLKNPNSYMDWSAFAARISRHYLLTNQTHFYAMGANNIKPSEIHPIKPINVTTTTKGEYVDIFQVGSGVAAGRYVHANARQRISRYYDGPLKELYRISGFSSMATDGSADSPLQAAALETNQQIKGRIHNTKVLENGGRLSLLIIFKDEVLLKEADHKRRTERINETFAGENKAGKIGVMSGGDIQSVTEMAKTQKDMDYAKLDEIAGTSIYFRYKIPLPLITTKATSFRNMETGIQMLYDMAVLPHADKLFSGLTRFLLPRFGIAVNSMKITYNPDSLQALKSRRLEELEKRKLINIETINEMRENIPNRKPVTNGDIIYQNMSLTPLGSDASNRDVDKEPGPKEGEDGENNTE